MSINKIYKLNKNLKAIGLALVIALFGGSIIALSSCDSNGDSSYNVDRLTAAQRADIEQAGIFHAKTLDAIITDFMRERVRVFQESANQSPKLRSATSTHVCLEQVALNTTKRLMKEWELVQDEQEAQAFMSELSVLNHGGTRASFEANVVRQLTPFQTEYYHRLMSMIERSDVMNELEPLLSAITALEMQIEQNAPTMEEAMPLLYAASVARHAAKYWNENRKKWFTVLFSNIVEAEINYENATTRGTVLGYAFDDWICPLMRLESIFYGKSIFLPHPHSSRLFILLSNGVGYVMECCCELVWDIEVESCNYGVAEESSSWLDRWGRCTITTIGGAIGGAIVGTGVGAGVGAAVTAPAGGVGAVPGAIIGGIAGGIGGGMYTAGRYCL